MGTSPTVHWRAVRAEPDRLPTTARGKQVGGGGLVSVAFADDLARSGSRPAVLTAAGEALSYRDLDVRVEERAAELGPGRRVVLVPATQGLEPLITYLAGLRAGHVTLLTSDDAGGVDRLISEYEPDTVVLTDPGGVVRIERRHSDPVHRLHPDLRLLLSTSGSTGSPKLVRLSADNLASNAEAIAGYLPIRDTDRAAVSLPLHYCYGLSVVNSNLLRGAALFLPAASVSDPRFWEAFIEHRVTSLHGVPYTFDLLDAVGFAGMDLPHLRYLTQAGGRWAPEAARRYGELATRRGWQLFVMYGQTEATSRMAYVPPDRLASAAESIGTPIPGGSFRIDDPDRHGVGELVYRGPNVMLGYARSPADLADGPTVDELRTGDLACRRPDGLYVLVGRLGRRLKLFGHRIELERVEDILGAAGFSAVCTGDDTELVVALCPGSTGRGRRTAARRVCDLLTAHLALPASAIRVVGVARLPRTGAGKIDYARLDAITRRPEPVPGAAPRTVPAVYRTVFPGGRVGGGDTFVELGGDSLRYVQASVELQRLLGVLPTQWPTMTVDELQRQPRSRPARACLEAPVVLRASAMLLIVGSHVGVFHILGGAHVLLMVAGWMFGRFLLAPGRPGSTSVAIVRSAARIAVPTALWILCRAAVRTDVTPVNALLLNYFVDPHVWKYWFIETLCQILLLLAALWAAPAVARLERRWPFGFPSAILAVALLGRLFPDSANEFSARLMSPHLVLWFFVLGWLVERADTAGRRALAAALIVVLVPTFFLAEPWRGFVAAAGALALLVPRLPVPRASVRPISAVGGASLAIYLTHYAIYPSLHMLPGFATVAVCLLAGVAVHGGAVRISRARFTAGRSRLLYRARRGGGARWVGLSSRGRIPRGGVTP